MTVKGRCLYWQSVTAPVHGHPGTEGRCPWRISGSAGGASASISLISCCPPGTEQGICDWKGGEQLNLGQHHLSSFCPSNTKSGIPVLLLSIFIKPVIHGRPLMSQLRATRRGRQLLPGGAHGIHTGNVISPGLQERNAGTDKEPGPAKSREVFLGKVEKTTQVS